MPSASGEEMVRERAALVTFTIATAIFGSLMSSVLFVAPVPLAVLVRRHGLRSGILTALVASALVGLVMGHPAAMMLVLLVLSLGIAIGEALRDELTLNQILAVSAGTAFLSFLTLYAVAKQFFQTDLVQATVQIWLDQFLRLSRPQGAAPLTPAEIADLTSQLRAVIPGMMALSGAGISTLCYWLTGRWLMRLGTDVPWFPPFAKWRFPWYVSWGYIAGLGLPLLVNTLHAPWLNPVAANLEVVFRVVFLVQGLAVLWYFFKSRGIRKPVGITLAVLFLLFTPILVFLGLIDAWFDLRRLNRIK